MKSIGTTELKTDRLILRRFVIEDANQVFCNYASDDEVTKFLSWPTHKNVEVTKEFLNSVISNYDDPDFYNWAITLKDTNEVIGSIAVVNRNDSRNQFELGYVISRKYWNNGYMTEVLKTVLNYALDYIKVFKVYCKCDTRNIASKRVMEKANMSYQKTTIGEDKNNLGVADCLVYSFDKSCQILKK